MISFFRIVLLLTMILSVSLCQRRANVPALPGGNFSKDRQGADGRFARWEEKPQTLNFPPDNVNGIPLNFGRDSESHPPRRPQFKNFRTRDRPSCSNNSDWDAIPCESDREYSAEIAERINQILIRTQMNAILQDETVRRLLKVSGIVRDKVLNPGTAFTRAGFITESPACHAQESIIYPQRARSTISDWVFVLNQDSVKQGVRVEKCLGEGLPCNLGIGQNPIITTLCRQKYIYRKMLVLSDSGNDIQPESVLMPSCCVCYIGRTDNNLVRSGSKSTTNQQQSPLRSNSEPASSQRQNPLSSNSKPASSQRQNPLSSNSKPASSQRQSPRPQQGTRHLPDGTRRSNQRRPNGGARRRMQGAGGAPRIRGQGKGLRWGQGKRLRRRPPSGDLITGL